MQKRGLNKSLGSNVHSVRCTNQIECDSFAKRGQRNNQKTLTLSAKHSCIHVNKMNLLILNNSNGCTLMYTYDFWLNSPAHCSHIIFIYGL